MDDQGARQGHLGPDDLAALALEGDRAPAGGRRHMERCRRCAAELDGYLAVVARLRDAGRSEGVTADGVPDERVWRRIIDELAETGEDTTAHAAGTVPPPVGTATDGDGRPSGLTDSVPADGVDTPPSPGAGGALRAAARRWRRRPAFAVAAGVAVVALAVAGVTAARTATPALVAGVTLEPLGAAVPDAAQAQLRRSDSGLELTVDLPEGTDEGGGYLELWLIDDSVDGMVSLGPVTAGTSRVRLPSELDVSRFPVVDVSREQLDGDPVHSGDSLWRGVLGTT